jgi:LmbE family N-acetylglucosaminyl deacetylase
VFSSSKDRTSEAMSSADILLETAKEKTVRIDNFRDSFFPYIGNEIKQSFEKIKQEYSPDIVFTHYRNDFHQDHRLIADLTWNTFRDHLILEYEIPKYDGDLGSPNFFVHLNESICHKKIEIILESFKSQNHNHWFSKETFLSMMTLRGIESNSPSKYAEGFYCRKLIF